MLLDKYQYEERVVCVLDILGYSKKVMETDNQDEFLPLKILSKIMSDYEKKGNTTELLNVKIFSDSIFISCSLEQISELFKFISTFIVQVLKPGENIDAKNRDYDVNLIRGGISYGKVCMSGNDSICFGPAIIRAHKLESEIAIFSRIIFDRNIVEKITDETIKAYICGDSDVPYFDFIKFLNHEKKEIHVESYIEILETKIDKNNLKISQKYEWFIKYLGKHVKQ